MEKTHNGLSSALQVGAAGPLNRELAALKALRKKQTQSAVHQPLYVAGDSSPADGLTEDESSCNSAYSSDGESARTAGSSSGDEQHDDCSPRSEPGARPFALDRHLSGIVGKDVLHASEFSSMADIINTHIDGGRETGSFLVTNLNKVRRAPCPQFIPIFLTSCQHLHTYTFIPALKKAYTLSRNHYQYIPLHP